MNTFTKRELGAIRKLRASGVDTAEVREPCPVHSECTPLPIFRVHKDSEDTFVAEWNDLHRKGPRQAFRFDDLPADSQSGRTR